MKQDYIAVADKSRIYPPGVAANGDGFDVCFISEAERCGLLLLKKGSRQPVARIPFPHEGRMGNVHFMTVKGEFEGLEYAFEEDGKEAARTKEERKQAPFHKRYFLMIFQVVSCPPATICSR